MGWKHKRGICRWPVATWRHRVWTWRLYGCSLGPGNTAPSSLLTPSSLCRWLSKRQFQVHSDTKAHVSTRARTMQWKTHVSEHKLNKCSWLLSKTKTPFKKRMATPPADSHKLLEQPRCCCCCVALPAMTNLGFCVKVTRSWPVNHWPPAYSNHTVSPGERRTGEEEVMRGKCRQETGSRR